MLTDQEKKDRNKRKATKRLRKKSDSPVVSLDAFRRLKFEGELRSCIQPFFNEIPSSDLLKKIKRVVKKVISKYARSHRTAQSVVVSVQYEKKGNTVSIEYFKNEKWINVYDLYDAISPGSKKLIGMHLGQDGSRAPIVSNDTN